MSETKDDLLVCTVAGTHSAGKTTLVHSFESGKVTDILGEDILYDDLGYGVIEHPGDKRVTPVVVVPETARWCANDFSKKPDLLGKNWNLKFQLQVNGMYMLRAHAGIEIAQGVAGAMAESDDREQTRPLVLTDRSVLEGLAYTRAHLPDQDTDDIGGFPRTAFYKMWTARYVDLVLLADHSEIPFEPDPARVNDLAMREAIAREVAEDYHSVLPADRIRVVNGSTEHRKAALAEFVREHLL